MVNTTDTSRKGGETLWQRREIVQNGGLAFLVMPTWMEVIFGLLRVGVGKKERVTAERGQNDKQELG